MRANVEERLGDVVAVRTESEFRYQGASAKADGGDVHTHVVLSSLRVSNTQMLPCLPRCPRAFFSHPCSWAMMHGQGKVLAKAHHARRPLNIPAERLMTACERREVGGRHRSFLKLVVTCRGREPRQVRTQRRRREVVGVLDNPRYSPSLVTEDWVLDRAGAYDAPLSSERTMMCADVIITLHERGRGHP